MVNNEKSYIKPILKKLTLAPELRDEPSKGAYPGGRVRQIFAVFKAEMNSLMRVNMWFILYTIPLIALVIYFMPNMVNDVSLQFNFMGNIGIGYPGTSDSTVDGLLALYNVYKLMLWLAVPCLLIIAVGLSGLMNCCKKFMWGEKVKPTKDFYNGVKKYWWKYIAFTVVFALIIVAVGQTVLWHMGNMAADNAGAGSWIITIAVAVIGFLLLTVFCLLFPMICTYDISILNLFKNSLILDSQLLLFSVLMLIFGAIPLVLISTIEILGLLIYMLLFMFGFVFYGLAFTGFGQMAFDNITTPLYNASVTPVKKPPQKKINQSGKSVNPKNYKKQKPDSEE